MKLYKRVLALTTAAASLLIISCGTTSSVTEANEVAEVQQESVTETPEVPSPETVTSSDYDLYKIKSTDFHLNWFLLPSPRQKAGHFPLLSA